jgi:hypothetical protein
MLPTLIRATELISQLFQHKLIRVESTKCHHQAVGTLVTYHNSSYAIPTREIPITSPDRFRAASRRTTTTEGRRDYFLRLSRRLGVRFPFEMQERFLVTAFVPRRIFRSFTADLTPTDMLGGHTRDLLGSGLFDTSLRAGTEKTADEPGSLSGPLRVSGAFPVVLTLSWSGLLGIRRSACGILWRF